MFPRRNGTNYLRDVDEHYANVRAYGCPMMDDTPYLQSPSGDIFVSPAGIETEASLLPCVSSPPDALILPDMCDICESRRGNNPRPEEHPLG